MTASAPASSMTLRVRTSAMALRSLQSLGGLGPATARTAAQSASSVVMNRTRRSGPPNAKFTAPGRWISPIRSPAGLKTCTPEDVVGTGRVEAPRLLVGTAVGDVEDRFVGREAQSVGLVEGVGHHRQAAGTRVEPVDVVADLRLGLEPLEVAVGRVGEPDRAVAADDDVVGRVE